MILKASQRGNGQNLAVHLMRTDDNEHVTVHELRGFLSDTLKGAFKEAEAISLGTKCNQYLFSLSLNPPERERVSVVIFEKAIADIEERLGLTGQPRAIVFHEKEGRRHAHCVWLRIDAQTMTARQMSFFKRKLTDLSREFYLEYGWAMPAGLADPLRRDPTNFTLAEWQQAKRLGADPRWIKQSVQECWKSSDSAKAFASALEARGYVLAKGDRRSHVVVDYTGEVFALSRLLGLKAKELRERLGDGKDLPDVDAAKKLLGERMTPAIRRHIEESRAAFRKRFAPLDARRKNMTGLHRAERAALDQHHKDERKAEMQTQTANLPKGLRALWSRLTGNHRKIRLRNEAEGRAAELRRRDERERLVARQNDERGVLQDEIKRARKLQAEEVHELRREVGWYLKVSRPETQSQTQKLSFEFRWER